MNKEDVKKFIDEIFGDADNMAGNVKKVDAAFMDFCKEHIRDAHIADRTAIHQHLAAINLAYTITGIRHVTKGTGDTEGVIKTMIESTLKEAQHMSSCIREEGIEIKFGQDPELDKLVKELLKRALEKKKDTKDNE